MCTTTAWSFINFYGYVRHTWHIWNEKNIYLYTENSGHIVVMLLLNSSSREAETGGSLRSWPAWSTEVQDSQGSTEKPFSKTNKQKYKRRKRRKPGNTHLTQFSGKFLSHRCGTQKVRAHCVTYCKWPSEPPPA